jgi:zinc protease
MKPLRLPAVAAFTAASVIAFVAPALPNSVNPVVLRAALDNGLRVAIVRDPIAPVVTTEMNYLVGSDEAPAGFPGMAHAQEHMMFRGSDGLTGDQLTSITAELGGDVNADTRQTVTQYHFTVPADDLELALRIEASRMRDVNDSQADWERERGAIDQEVAMDNSNPQYLFYKALLATAFAGTPYAHDGLGTRESFDKTDASMLKAFYRDWYGPNNALLVIAGDVDPTAALAQVKALFGSIPRRPTPPHPAVVISPIHNAQLTLQGNFAFQLSFISYRLPGYDSADFVPAQILVDVLQSKRGALAALVARGSAIAAQFDQSAPLPKAGLGYAIAVSSPGQDTAAQVESVKQIMADYSAHGVPDDLVEAAKHRELVQAAEDQASVPAVASSWSEALAVGGRNSPNDDVAAISAVTTADVNRMAKQYLAPDQAIVAIIKPSRAPSGGNAASNGAGESFALPDTKPVALPGWAAAKLTALTIPAAPPAAPSEVLPNGVRIIVVPEAGNPSVEVVGEVKTAPAVEAPQGQEGVAEVENDLFAYGTTALDRTQYQAALDQIGADETGGTRFSVKMLAADFDRGMQLLSDNELHPAFPEAAFNVVQRQDEGVSLGRKNSADYQVQRALNRALFPLFDPVLRETTPETVAALTLADVKDYYAKTFRPDLTTIVVIGDVTPDQAYAEVEKWFGGWTTYVPPPSVELPAVPANDPATSVFSPPGQLQDVVSMSETLSVVRSNHDYYALRLGNELLGGATLASRLYKDLREDRGLVYFVNSNLDVGNTRSTYSLRFGCDPGNVSRAKGILRSDILAMQTKPAAGDELQRAKALLIRQIPLAESSEDDIARGLLSRAVANLPLNEPQLAAEQYVALTSGDVMKAFAQWIRPDGFAQVVEGPYPR